MSDHKLDEICCARLPATALPALAALRCRVGVQAIVDGGHVWLRWPAGDDVVLGQVLPAPGVELFYQFDGGWRQLGRRLPVAGPPAGPVQRLDTLIVPERVTVIDPARPASEPVRLRLARDGRPRPVAGMLCDIDVLHDWAVQATTAQLRRLRAARLGSRVLLFGDAPPALAGGTRLWGRRLLVPLGYRAEPALPESAWVEALQLRESEIAVVCHASASSLGGFALAASEQGLHQQTGIVPDDAFQMLTRACVRLAHAEARP